MNGTTSKTKRITAREYYKNSNLRPWSVREAIVARVNREAEAMTQITMPPLPTRPAPKLRLSEAVRAAMGYDIVDRWVMPLLP